MVCAVPIIAPSARGNLITYTPVSGANYSFTNITEDPTRLAVPVSSEAPPTFGQPVGGDSLSFPALAFKSSATGGMDLADSKLSMTISAKSLAEGITDISLVEFGDYSLARTGTTSNPFTQAKASGWVTIQEVNGSAIAPIVIPTIAGLQFDSQHTLPGSSLSDIASAWSGSLNFDVEQALKDHNITGLATKVSFSMDNTLYTSADAQSLAYIAKKGVTLTVTGSEVPEPATFTLLGLGALGLAVWMKRKR